MQRYLALDIFRGMTIALMIFVNTPGSWTYIYAPFEHAPWHGLTPTDLVFPSFMFIVGVAMRFAFKAYNYTLSPTLTNKILKRSALIFLIGLLIALFPFYDANIGRLRILGVLQRIALSYACASFIVLLSAQKWIPYIIGGILLAYWAIMWFFGDSGMQYEMIFNAGYKLDMWLLGPNHLYRGEGVPFDPEGLLSTLPAIGTVLLGYSTGILIQASDNKYKLVQDLLIAGTIAILIALVWHTTFPINKKLWTSSYVLVCAGIDAILLAILMYIIDIKNYTNWSKFFHVFGVNPMAAYIIAGLISKTMSKLHIYGTIYTKFYQPIFGNYLGSHLFALSVVLLTWLCILWLYRRKIYWRV